MFDKKFMWKVQLAVNEALNNNICQLAKQIDMLLETVEEQEKNIQKLHDDIGKLQKEISDRGGL